MWKKCAGVFFLAGILLLAGCRQKESIPVSLSGSSLEEENPADTLAESSLPGAEIPAYEVELPEELSSFAAAIWGEVYEFPVSWQEFTEKGWEYRGTADQTVDSRSYLEGERFEKDGNVLYAYILNPETDILSVEDCSIAGIQVDTAEPEGAEIYVNLPGEIVLQQSQEQDVRAAYGEPVDCYESSRGVVLTYEYGTYRSVQLGFDGETGTLRTVDLKNIEIPEETAPVSADVPAEVQAYREPEGPGEKLSENVVQYGGVYYRLPVPVREMEKNGWSLCGEESDPAVEGGQYGHATLERDGIKLYTVVRNSGEETAAVRNCLVTELSGDLDTVKVPVVLAGGITLGMPEEAFLEAAGEETFEKAEDPENGTVRYTFYRGDSEVDCTEVTVDSSLKLIREIRIVCNNDQDLEQSSSAEG
ncbi:MAG TPA: hypothetical protein IAB71_06060 [Candidatus Scatomonas pullistercoris]|uniref:Lipoprotein n=1 Tax=Candidatus Scatomonas pullistercoris TaxID=2840920 RepID=A0A9D1P3E9_9FIRM|nr:hypothetical protein [Candidatus Scatomonas pullistercoris]